MGRYLGEYLRKDWESRLLEDKGARCVRYFGHWSKEPRKKGGGKGTPPHKSRFGWLTPRASVWREMVKQTVIVLNHNGAKITEQNIKDVIGPRWAWKMAKLFPAVAFIDGDWQSNPVQGEIAKHNADVRFNWVAGGGDPARQCWWYVTEITLDHLRPSPHSRRHCRRHEDVRAAAKNADVLYTDVWVSMGKEAEAAERLKVLAPYQVNAAVLKHAKPGALVMHCLPAYVGKEISADVFEAHQKTIFDQAENRLHVQKAIMTLLAGKL